MDPVFQHVIQGGALGLLAYLIIWGTRIGAPKLFTAMHDITSAINRNTDKLADVEEKQRQQTEVVLRLVEAVGYNGSIRKAVKELRERVIESED